MNKISKETDINYQWHSYYIKRISSDKDLSTTNKKMDCGVENILLGIVLIIFVIITEIF